MERSKCVICGRKRERRFLKKVFGLWICHYTLGWRKTNEISLLHQDKTHIRYFTKCEIRIFEKEKNQLNKAIELFDNELKRNIPIEYHSPGFLCPFRKDEKAAGK